MSSKVKVIHDTCCTIWHWGQEAPLSSVGMQGTRVKKDSESANTSLSASLVSFKRRSSSCRVIRAGILAIYANMSKRNGAFLEKGSFSRIYQTNFLLLLFVQWQGWCPGKCNSSRRYWLLCLVGCLVVLSQVLFIRPCAHWLRSSGLCCESRLLFLRATEKSHYCDVIYCQRHDVARLTLSLGWLDSHCSSLTMSRCTHMIFLDFIVEGTRPLAS